MARSDASATRLARRARGDGTRRRDPGRVARGTHAVEQLGDENRALDRPSNTNASSKRSCGPGKSRSSTILRDSPDMIAMLDSMPGAARSSTGPTSSGIRGTARGRDGLYALVHPEDRDDADAHWARLPRFRARTRSARPRCACATATAHDRFVRLRFSSAQRPDDDVPATLLGLLSDVTEEWANQLREAELHEALRGRNASRRSVSSPGRRHDFNNVLAAVRDRSSC